MKEYKAMIIIKQILDELSTNECQRVFAWVNAYVAQREGIIEGEEEQWER
jgi:hypothetical protein